MLENKATSSIKGSAFAPKINAYLQRRQPADELLRHRQPERAELHRARRRRRLRHHRRHRSGTATRPAPTPCRTCRCPTTPSPAWPARRSRPPARRPRPSTTTSPASPNLFNALSAAGIELAHLQRIDEPGPGRSAPTASPMPPCVAQDDVYAPGTLARQRGGRSAHPACACRCRPALYKTKHHPGMAYQNVRSAPEFKYSNRTMGGGQWDATLKANSTAYAVPAGLRLRPARHRPGERQGRHAQLRRARPVRRHARHRGHAARWPAASHRSRPAIAAASPTTCRTRPAAPSSPAATTTSTALVKQIQASPIWKNPSKRVAIVLMFDEGNATSGFNSCCGWNVAQQHGRQAAEAERRTAPFSVDSSVNNYTRATAATARASSAS